MKKIFILLLIIATSITLKATGYIGVRYSFHRQHTKGQDSIVRIEVVFSAFSFADKKDSFDLIGDTVLSRYLAYDDNFQAYDLYVKIWNKKGVLLGSYNAASSLNAVSCAGVTISDPFGKQTCLDLNSMGGGVICGSIDFKQLLNQNETSVLRVGGHFSRPLDVYCFFNEPNQEKPLKLQVPCSFRFLNQGTSFKWYESANGKDNWKFVDTGWEFFPAKQSYSGGRFYNQQRFYRVECDTHHVIGLLKYSTPVFGPVKFYLGMKIDSIRVRDSGCASKKDVILYFTNDTFLHNNYGPRIWLFYRHPDSTREFRYQLQTSSWSPLSLYGQKWINQSVSPNHVQSLDFTKGKYRVMYDFTPWNGFDCKLFFDSFVLLNNLDQGFSIKINLLDSLKCFGDSNARIAMHAVDADTARYWWTADRLHYHQLPDSLDKLKSGNYKFYFRNAKGCEISSSIKVAEPNIFYAPFKLDTILCKGQYLFLSLNHPNAQSQWLENDRDTFKFKDTISIRNAGIFIRKVSDYNGCVHTDTIRIKRRNTEILHDFLLPSKTMISDSVYAVVVSKPQPEKFWWGCDRNDLNSKNITKYTQNLKFTDTGIFKILFYGNYEGCGYKLAKFIHVLGKTDSSKISNKYGYKWPLIQEFKISPNPNNGVDFKLIVKLREKENISVYKIDPVTGEIVGDIDFTGKDYYEFTAFKSYSESVFFLKVVARGESKMIKVVVIPD